MARHVDSHLGARLVPPRHLAKAPPPDRRRRLAALAGVLAQGPQLPKPVVYETVTDWAVATNHTRTVEMAWVRREPGAGRAARVGAAVLVATTPATHACPPRADGSSVHPVPRPAVRSA